MSDAGNTVSERQYFGYCLVGFDSFLDFRTVEFSEQLQDAHVCDSCGAVPGEVMLLPCMHTTCKFCYVSRWTGNHHITICAVDKQQFYEQLRWSVVKDMLYPRTVRCPNTSYGCNHTCTLQELGTHFPKCQFVWTVCCLCGSRTPFVELPDHYVACRSLLPCAGATFAKYKQLVQDLTNATKEVEDVAEKSSEGAVLRQKIDSMFEVLEKLRVQVGNASI